MLEKKVSLVPFLPLLPDVLFGDVMFGAAAIILKSVRSIFIKGRQEPALLSLSSSSLMDHSGHHDSIGLDQATHCFLMKPEPIP